MSHTEWRCLYCGGTTPCPKAKCAEQHAAARRRMGVVAPRAPRLAPTYPTRQGRTPR